MRRFVLLCAALLLAAWSPEASGQSVADQPQQLNGFSRAVAMSGDTLFVGEPRTSHTPGRVFVFAKDGDAWTQATSLEAEDGEVGDGFGSRLAANGETLVSASSDAVYVFDRDGDTWTQSARLTPSDSINGYGSDIALAGDRLFVSASSRRGTGAVYVYDRQDDGTWRESSTLVGGDVEPGNQFGASVAATQTHVLVGAPGKDGGVVFAFRKDDTGDWVEQQMISRESLDGRAAFGSTLHLHSDEVLIGAPRANAATGTVYPFDYDADAQVWRASGQLMPFDGAPRHLFGAALGRTDSGVWVGAPGADRRTGVLYHFVKDTETDAWSAAERITHPDAATGAMLGMTLAASSQTVAAGMPGSDYGAGSLSVFEPEAATWTASAPLIPDSESPLQAITGNETPCTDGSAEGYNCQRVDLLSFLPLDQIGADRGVVVNDIWGWTDAETGREYALVGRTEGTSFVDVTDATNPVYIGDLPMTEGARGAVWRDVKVYDNHAYIVADNAGEHGMQVFDLTALRDADRDALPLTFEQTAHYDNVHSAHNVVINTDTGFGYIVGSSGGGQTCGGGLHMVNLQEPARPTFAGCFADPSTGRTGTGYSHDAQCVVYEGPDSDYQGREICLGFNETAISIADVTDKEAPKAISTASYPNHAYVHQGWFTEDQRYFYVNDELDEINGLADNTRTLIWDVTDLDDPQLVKEYFLSEPSTDHNLYIKGSTMYQSNYVSGLRMLDVSDPENPEEVGHFDTVPFGDNSAGFGGSWSNYPYFESGTIVVTSMNEGLFVVKKSQQGL